MTHQTTFTVSALGQMSDLTTDRVWQREPNPFRGKKRLLPGSYTCERFRLPSQQGAMVRRLESGRERATYVIVDLVGYVAIQR